MKTVVVVVAAPLLPFARMAAQDTARLLRGTSVFASLPATELEALAALAHEARHRARDYVFMEGDPAEWLCVVKRGRVKILRMSPAGKDVVLELLGPGEIFGGVAVIERRPYPAAAQAAEASEVVKLPAAAVIALAERHPSVIREMALMIGRRLRTAHDSVRSLAVDPVEARLASTLLRLAEHEGVDTGAGRRLPFHLTRQSLADMTGTTVETAIRVVSRWMRDDLVVDEGGRFVLHDVEALRDLAEGRAE
jgi:CRP/FNR family transcriptional regulator